MLAFKISCTSILQRNFHRQASQLSKVQFFLMVANVLSRASPAFAHSPLPSLQNLQMPILATASKNMKRTIFFCLLTGFNSSLAPMNMRSMSLIFRCLLSIKPDLQQKEVKPIQVTCGQDVSAAISMKHALRKQKFSKQSLSILTLCSCSFTNLSSFQLLKS